jgi:hypothetical protein
MNDIVLFYLIGTVFIHQQENYMTEFCLLLFDDEKDFVETIARCCA